MKPAVLVLVVLAVLPALPLGAGSSLAPAPEALTVHDNLRIRTLASPTLSFQDFFGLGGRFQWDLMGDSTGFYVIDAAHGTMPFWVQPRVPVNSLVMAASGDVGLGTSAPLATLHLRRSAGEAQFLVEEASPLKAERTLMNLRHGGGALIAFTNTAPGGVSWTFGTLESPTQTDFVITGSSSGATPAFVLTAAGDLTIAGGLTQLSDRNAKWNVEPVDGAALLERAAALPVSTWRYAAGHDRHIGPTAQDFAAAFGLGEDDRHIAPADVAGVGLAAAQALEARTRGLAARFEDLERRIHEKDAQLALLEAELLALEGEDGLRPEEP